MCRSNSSTSISSVPTCGTPQSEDQPTTPTDVPASEDSYVTTETPRTASCGIRQVWSWNFEAEMKAFLAAAALVGAHGLIAVVVEFPSLVRSRLRACNGDDSWAHAILCECLATSWPIQIAFAIADSSGTMLGTWSFNLTFDTADDVESQAGVSPWLLGALLSSSPIIQDHVDAPFWITLAGSLDLGYLLKIITGRSTPQDLDDFDVALAHVCPKRLELQDNIDNACNAWSDALAVLDVYFSTQAGSKFRSEANPLGSTDAHFTQAKLTPTYRPRRRWEKNTRPLQAGRSSIDRPRRRWGSPIDFCDSPWD